jgi:hypothetical protein
VKRKFQAILSSLILVFFLAGTTGITLFIHTCTSSHKTEISAYPEIFKHTSDCCCAEEGINKSVASSKDLEIDNPECCKNQHLFLKAYITGLPVVQNHLINTPLFQTHPVDLMNLIVKERHLICDEYLPWLDHSPPLSGKTLVYFIHQIRIPYPVC